MSNEPKRQGTGTAPDILAQHASNFIRHALDSTDLSMLDLASAFKIAQASCEEAHSVKESAEMAAKIRNWRPGSY